MTKKVLMLAAKANMIQQFNHRNIKILQDLGYEVHVATNMVDFGSMSAEENERFKQWMIDNHVIAHQIDFERRMGSLKGNLRSIKQLRQLFKDNQFTFIHVHSPLGSILGRLVAKQFKVPAIYTAHGFHFFKGGPKSGWLVFYPLEWFFSFITDTLITINDEDFVLAKKHMHAKHTIKINGIGVDVEGAWSVTDEEKTIARKKIRQELNIPEDAFLILSVGELSNRKNHEIVLKAIKNINKSDIFYIIAGTGPNEKLLIDLANKYGIRSRVKLLGYRNDIHELNYAANVNVFPSLREGLGFGGLQAVIDGTYLIAANIGGIKDYLLENISVGFNPQDVQELTTLLQIRYNNREKFTKFSSDNVNKLLLFDKESINEKMNHIYNSIKGN